MNGIKTIRREIMTLGFHHCWGKIINNENGLYQIFVKQTRNRKTKNVIIHMTKDGVYKHTDCILVKPDDKLSDVRYQIKKFFGTLTVFDYSTKELIQSKIHLN